MATTAENEMPEAPAPKLLLTAAQAADVLSIGRRKLWELTNCKQIKCVRIGRAVRYRYSDLEDFTDRLKP